MCPERHYIYVCFRGTVYVSLEAAPATAASVVPKALGFRVSGLGFRVGLIIGIRIQRRVFLAFRFEGSRF